MHTNHYWFLESLAKERRIVAIGECGLDRHYLTDAASMMEQERVLRLLMKVRYVREHD